MKTSLSIATLAAQPTLRRSRDLLAATDAETLDLQRTICQTAAPTGAEAPRARLVASRLRSLGLVDVHRDAAGNIVGHWGQSNGTAIVLVAHLDTVFGPEVDLTVRQQGTRLTGPGISDNARGLAALLAIARAVSATGWETERPIIFAATVGEEGAGDLKGAKHLLGPAGVQAAAVIALDGAGLDRVVHRALGSRRFRITYRGPGGHSWAAYGVANPAHALGYLASRIPDIPHPPHPRSACSLVRMQAGTGLNSIPQMAWAELDTRSEHRGVLDDIEQAVRTLATEALDCENRRRSAGTPALGLTIEQIGDRPAGVTPSDHPLVQAALESTRAVRGQPELAAASTDANVAIAQGIPAVALGAGGRAGDTHLPTEWYDNTGGPDGLYRALLVVAAAAGLRGGDRGQ